MAHFFLTLSNVSSHISTSVFIHVLEDILLACNMVSTNRAAVNVHIQVVVQTHFQIGVLNV